MGGVRSSCSVTDLRQLTSTEEICRYAPGTDRDVRACGHFTANQAAASGRDDQKMREINPAGVRSSNIYVDIVKAAGPAKGTGASASQFTLHSSQGTALVGVALGMTVGFKLKATADMTPSFVAQGTVTQVDATARTFTVSALSSATVFADGEWNKADCGTPAADCCAGTACQIHFQQNLKAELMDEREVEIGDRIRMLTSLGSWETRTVDSVTYGTGFQVSGFVVSEPYENTVSTTGTTAGTQVIAADGTFTSSVTVTACDDNDFCKVTGVNPTSADGVYKVSSIASPITFDTTYGVPGEQTVQQVYTLTKAHLAYNDGAGTTEAKSCSGRGLCDDSSGECQCFKGYTGVDCSIQNALAV
jgi:hypothetical protein